MKLKPTSAEIVKSIMSEKYVQDRFESLDWSNYETEPESYWGRHNYKTAKRKGGVTIKIEGGYARFSEEQKSEIVSFLKKKFSGVKEVLGIEFKVSENYAGTQYDWLKIKLAH